MRPTEFQPKFQNQFVLEIEGIDSFLVRKANILPSLTIGEKEIDWINLKRYLAGSKPKFDTVSITLWDPIAPSGMQLVMEWVRLHWEQLTGRAGYADFYKRDIVLKLLDPPGNVISRLEYTGAFITTVNFGAVQPDYSADEFLNIELTLRFDNFVLTF